MTTQIDLMNQVRGYYIGTEAAIEALTGVPEGSIGYAIDTNQFGSYDGSSWSWGTGGVTDHGALTGLGDDDHPQYLLVTNAYTDADALAAILAVIDNASLIYVGGVLKRAGIIGDIIVAAGDNTATINNDDLIAIMGLTPTNDDILQRKAGAWANRTLTQLWTDLKTLTGFPVDGTYTPTAVKGTNITADGDVVPGLWNYSRVGDHVRMGGLVQINTTAAGAFTCYLSIPIASNFQSADDASGNGTNPGTGVPNIISVRPDSNLANDRLQLDGYSQVDSNLFYRVVVDYRIRS